MLTSKHPKAKPCVVCERVFVPERMGQQVCRPACGLKKARADRLAGDRSDERHRAGTELCLRHAG